jgi:hypothetical protein
MRIAIIGTAAAHTVLDATAGAPAGKPATFAQAVGAGR